MRSGADKSAMGTINRPLQGVYKIMFLRIGHELLNRAFTKNMFVCITMKYWEEASFIMRVPPLETERLIVRPFTINDLDEVHQLLDVDLHDAVFGNEGATTRDERQQCAESDL